MTRTVTSMSTPRWMKTKARVVRATTKCQTQKKSVEDGGEVPEEEGDDDAKGRAWRRLFLPNR